MWPVSPHVSLGLHDAMGACVSAYDSLARTHALRGVPAVLVPLHARVYPQSHCDSGNSSGAERATFCASVCCLMPNVAWPVASVPACPSVSCLSATVWGEVLRDMHSRCSPSYIFYWHCSRFALDRSCVLVRRRTFAHSHTLRRWLRCVAYSRTYVAGTRVRHMWRRYRRVWLMRNGAYYGVCAYAGPRRTGRMQTCDDKNAAPRREPRQRANSWLRMFSYLPDRYYV